MSEIAICTQRDPVSGRKCGLYAPHPMPHRLLKIDRIVDKAGFERVEWDASARWVKVRQVRTDVRYLSGGDNTRRR